MKCIVALRLFIHPMSVPMLLKTALSYAPSSTAVRRLLCAILACWTGLVGAEELRFSGAEAWRLWSLPNGLIEFDAAGGLHLVRYDGQIEAVRTARSYQHMTQERGLRRGGIWQVGSGVATAQRAIDGNADTYWQPDPDDGLRDWRIEVDLGRVVLAQEVVLRFPDRPGARPFRQFDAYVSAGNRFRGRSDDVFIHQQIYETTLPNRATEIRIPLSFELGDTLIALDDAVAIDPLRHFLPVQYVRLEASALSEDAALAEVEVYSIGGNIGPGTLERGGAIKGGERASSITNALDGDMDTRVSLRRGPIVDNSWRASGMWLQVDLGAEFWVDRLFLSPLRSIFALSTARRLLVEGENAGLSPFLVEDDIVGNYDHFFYAFSPRKIRHLIFHSLDEVDWGGSIDEFMIYATGHPAEVVLRSDFIDLGELAGDGRAKAISSLTWSADVPPDTRIQLRSRSGDTLREEYTFYDRKGDIVTERTWNSTPKVLRGPIDSALVVSGDWDEWSNVYQLSGEPFKSRTPARLVQLEAILATDQPVVAPVLHHLTLNFSDALVQQALGRVLPREVESNQFVRFRYVLWPESDARDRGFNRLRIALPGPLADEGVALRVGGVLTQPSSIFVEADSLLYVNLPQDVKTDSVDVEFTARVLENATQCSAELGRVDDTSIWQAVAPLARHADVVFTPDLIGRGPVIEQLEISPAIFTPNDDGRNDAATIRFDVLNVQGKDPRVHIFDLSGRRVAELVRQSGRRAAEYVWNGRDMSGHRVAPGTYLCAIDLVASAQNATVVRSLVVAY